VIWVISLTQTSPQNQTSCGFSSVYPAAEEPRKPWTIPIPAKGSGAHVQEHHPPGSHSLLTDCRWQQAEDAALKGWEIHRRKKRTTLAGDAGGEHVPLEAFETEKRRTLLRPLLFLELWVNKFLSEASKIHPSEGSSTTAAET